MNRRNFLTGAATVAGGALLTRLVPTATAAEPGKAAVSTGKTEPFNPACGLEGLQTRHHAQRR